VPTNLWSFLPVGTLEREADVENRLVLPLLAALGYSTADIRPKYPVIFQQGRKGRPHEADFAVFAREPHGPETSLLVVEAKAPGEALSHGKAQCDSYAFALRAPFLLLTNGQAFQIWQLQLTGKTELRVECTCAALPSKRGEIEAILHKAAAIQHCTDLSWKRVGIGEIDFMPYLDPFIREHHPKEPVLSRDLVSPVNKSARMPSERALEQSPGVVVVAPSGHGKSTLGLQLTAMQANRVLSGASRALPFLVYLPDAAAKKISAMDYAYERLTPHVPQVATRAVFQHHLRESGAFFFLDGLDRLSPEERRLFSAEVRAITSDYPKVHVVVTVRPIGPIDLPLPIWELADLTSEEQDQLANLRGVRIPWNRVIRDLCRNPYLLVRTLDQLERAPNSLVKLDAIMDGYRDQLLRSDDPELDRLAERLEALLLIADLTLEHGISLTELRAQIKRAELPADILNDLGQLGAITSGVNVEMSHEILGDFMRAEKHSKLSDGELLRTIEGTSIPSGSMYPLFIAALARTPERQSQVLNALMSQDLRGYFLALPLRAEIPHGAGQIWFLTEIRDGFWLPIEMHWPDLRNLLEEEIGLEQSPSEPLGIAGAMDGRSLVYAYEPSRPGADTVRVGAPSDLSPSIHFVTIPKERPYDSGRDIGTEDLRKHLLKLIEDARLPGGKTWRHERLRWRLNGLFSGQDLRQYQLQEMKTLFVPQRGSWISDNPEIRVDELIEDIELLISLGEATLSADALPNPDASPSNGIGHWSEFYTDSTLSEIVRQRHIQSMQAYREVAEATFGSSARLLANYQALPVRYESTVIRRPESGMAVEYPRWYPVMGWDDVDVKVTIATTSPPHETWGDFDAIADEMRRLGRNVDSVRRTAWRALDLDRGDGKSEVLRQVAEWLEQDIKALFASH